ncbi:MAG: M23 family metallopeptidase [Oscillospiraceae bacterium]
MEGGFATLYAHCSRITASSGQQVRPGDPIAGRWAGPATPRDRICTSSSIRTGCM